MGWEPFRTILLIMLDSGLRPGEIYRMRWENIHWEQGLIFNPRGKSRKSKRYVPLTERMKAALLVRKAGVKRGMGVSVQEGRNPVISPTARFPSSGWKPNGWQVFLNLSYSTVLGIASPPMRCRPQATSWR